MPKPYEKMCHPGQRVQTDNGAEFTKNNEALKGWSFFKDV
jgi:hypothetical protein